MSQLSPIQRARGTAEYKAVAALYEGKAALRSEIPYMSHIEQGLAVLEAIGASMAAMRAYCLHPLFQADEELSREGMAFAASAQDAYPVALAMEYRRVANAHLSRHELPEGGVELSPLKEVNDMLIADKAQNRKDFEAHHLGSHPRSERLDRYFKEWLSALGVSEARYQELRQMMASLESAERS